MINRSLTKLVLALTAGVFVSVASAKPTLKEVTDATEAAAAKAPDQAAAIVEAKVTATPEYACPIIKAAAKGARIQKQDETELVAAALKAAPERAPEIRACLAEGKVASGKHPVGKSPVHGNGVVTETPEQGIDPDTGLPYGGGSDYNNFRGVVGTYLSVPSGGSGTTETTTDNTSTTPVVIIKQNPTTPASRS